MRTHQVQGCGPLRHILPCAIPRENENPVRGTDSFSGATPPADFSINLHVVTPDHPNPPLTGTAIPLYYMPMVL